MMLNVHIRTILVGLAVGAGGRLFAASADQAG